MEIITILTGMIPENNLQGETCCLHLEIIFYRGLIESFITWHNSSHRSSIFANPVEYQRTRTEHKVVAMTADNASKRDVAAKKLQILKRGCFAHVFNPTTQRIYTISTVSTWTPKISLTNSVSDQMSPLLSLMSYDIE